MRTAKVTHIYPLVPFPKDGPDAVGVFDCSETGERFLDQSHRVVPMLFLIYPEPNNFGVECPKCRALHKVVAPKPIIHKEIATEVTDTGSGTYSVRFSHPALPN